MDLNFKKEGNYYVAEFKAPGDFNLHLERNGKGSLVLSQSGVEQGAYERFYSQNIEQGKTIFDRDFGALVYPKYIKVVSGSEVVSASVNFNEGGGSGSGSGSGDVADGWEYFDLSSIEDERKFVFLDSAQIYPVMMHAILKVDADNNHIIGSPFVYDETKHTLKSVAVFTPWDGIYIEKYGTFYDFVESSGLTEFVSSIPRITKEQFYNL